MHDLFAILSTVHGCPEVGCRLLIALPRPDANPHAVGLIMSAVPYVGGSMPTFFLTVSIENADDAAARAEFPRALALDCYPTIVQAEKWHAVDETHVGSHGYGRNHWF